MKELKMKQNNNYKKTEKYKTKYNALPFYDILPIINKEFNLKLNSHGAIQHAYEVAIRKVSKDVLKHLLQKEEIDEETIKRFSKSDVFAEYIINAFKQIDKEKEIKNESTTDK